MCDQLRDTYDTWWSLSKHKRNVFLTFAASRPMAASCWGGSDVTDSTHNAMKWEWKRAGLPIKMKTLILIGTDENLYVLWACHFDVPGYTKKSPPNLPPDVNQYPFWCKSLNIRHRRAAMPFTGATNDVILGSRGMKGPETSKLTWNLSTHSVS